MVSGMEYVPASPDPVQPVAAVRIADIKAEGARQQKIREWHHLISPWAFSNREKVKRNIAIFLRNYGEAKVRRSQEAK